MISQGVSHVLSFWNGPVRAAQDFQSQTFAIEVKTTIANDIDTVTISSAEQLDLLDLKHLFLSVVRISEDGVKGRTLPQLIKDVEAVLPLSELSKFRAKLMCIGYEDSFASQYKDSYLVKEIRHYEVKDGFPCIRSSMLPKEIDAIRYRLRLSSCESYVVSDVDMMACLEG